MASSGTAKEHARSARRKGACANPQRGAHRAKQKAASGFEAEHAHGFGQRLPGPPVIRPRVERLERQMLARRGDRPLRAALELWQSIPGHRHRDAEAGRARAENAAAVVAPWPLRR